ncbi:PH domain protein [Ancylostoma ceylanicum]|uniref:PH domain protein n=1 Tax=Ancylostoma ceylanicum TaxID=53326 RepID=A0A0D6LVM4_9BILA|nr:PH domain protein [Ancylostoma ceylanicum]
MEEDMGSRMNESILIETSNRINAHESRIFQKDIALYEHDLKETKENLRALRLDLSTEVNKRMAAEDDLRRRLIEIEELEHKLKNANDATTVLQEKLVDKDQMITQLGSEVSSAKFEISTLQTRLSKSRQDVEEARARNKELSLEIASLKVALAESKEELRRNIEDVKDQKENMTKREIELRRSLETNFVSHNISTSHNLLNAFQSLSSQLVTMQKTQFTAEQTAEIQLKVGELSATNKFLEEKVMEYKEKEDTLSKQLTEARDNAEAAKVELAALQKKLVDIEGSSSLTHQYLLEESNKIKQQKADLRCELLELRRDYTRQKEKLEKVALQSFICYCSYECYRFQLESNKIDEKEVAKLRSDLESYRTKEENLQKENSRLTMELRNAEEKLRQAEETLRSTRHEVGELTVEQKINQELREELKKAEAKMVELTNTLVIVDKQCEQFRELKKRAEAGRQKALNECADVTVRLREAERELERQRVSEVEVTQLRAEKDRLEMKIRYLNDELRETHNDYRAELAQLAKQISETKCKDATENEHYTVKIDELKNQLAQSESSSRSAKRQVEELKLDNQKLQEQLAAGVKREQETTDENKKLRGGLTDALVKIDHYKKEAERVKETCQEMAEQLGLNEERMSKLEEEVINLEEMLREKEKLEAYLQSQIKARDMPKLSRRSTLLRTPTDSSLEIIDPVVVEELENQKSSLLRELEEKKKELISRKMMPPPLPRDHRQQPSAPYSNTLTRHPMAGLQSKSVAEIRYTAHQQNRATTLGTPNAQKAIMRHDIPHSFILIQFAKKKRCAHCGIIVHSQCASRVVNTCGLPDQCANYYLDSHSATNGKMNGWVRMFRDDSHVREWQSAWGEMDEKRLVFYDNDSVQTDLRKPFLSIDLEKELRIVRVGSEVPVKTDNGQVSHNIVHIKTETRNVYILAPSTQTAKRWAEALQNASTRRMMLTRRPSSFSEQSCLLVLSTPNNLTIHTTCVFDDYLLIGAQSGLFFTYISSPRVPVRISGFNSVPAMECLPDLNILALVMDHRRTLALLPLSALKSELNAVQPSLRADILGGYDNLHAIAYHQQDGNRLWTIRELKRRENQERNGGMGADAYGVRYGPRSLGFAGVFNCFWITVYTAPYLYVVHYDSIEIMQVAEYTGPDSSTILDEREVYECRNAHVVCCRPNGDVYISISNTDSVEVHRFNATNSKRSAVKRKGLSAATFDKRSKVAL